MKRKLILTAVPAIVALCAFAGCGGENAGNSVIPDSGEFDLTKATITGAEEQVTAELGTRYVVPVPTVEYNGTKREVTFEVFDSENVAVDLIARGTRFYVESVNDYKINYYITYLGESKLVASSSVTVVDTQGPEIILPASAYTMTVYKDSVVNIPVPTVRDGSGHVESTGVKVTFKGEAVEIQAGAESELGSFTAANYGEYVIEYTATDGSDNTTVEPVTVNCARMITLCDFENGNNSWANGTKYVTEHAYSGNALQATSNGATDYQMIAAYTPYYNLSGFDSFAINVWSSRDCTASNDGFYLLNQLYRLREGDNIIVIDREAFASQYPNSMIPSTLRPNYKDLMYVYFQICGENLTVVVDNFVGIFDNYEEDAAAPTIDFGKDYSLGEITLDDGKEFVLPSSVTAYDNSMENCTIDYTVKKTDGTDITAAVKAGFRVSYSDGKYIVTYSATDAAGNTGTRDFTVNVRALDIAPGDDAPENRGYVTLQNFDTLDGVAAEGGIVLSLEEALARKDKAVKVTSPDQDSVLKIRLLKDGNVLTAEDLKNIAYLQVSVISDSDNVPLRLGSERYVLQYGLNKLVLSGSFFAQMADYYDGEGWFTCTVGSLADGYNLYFDQFLAVAENTGIYRPEQDYDLLQTFERSNCLNTEAPVAVSAEYADEGVSVKVEPNAWQVFWVKLALNGRVPTVEELGEYDHIEFVIYASASTELYFRNTPVATLAAGRNVVSVPIAVILEEIKSGKDAAYGLQAYHTDNGETYWQVGSAVTLWLDNFYAVYGEETPDIPGPVDPSDEEFDETKVEVTGLTEVQTAELNEDYTVLVPEVLYNGTARNVITKVFDQDGNDVELRRGKFLAANEDGYVVRFYISYNDEEYEVASAAIGVADTKGPEITIAATSSMIGKDSVVAIPAATAADNSGVVASITVKVTFNGEEVTVTEGADGAPDTFVPAAYGDYLITFTATDGSGNATEKSVTVSCVRTVLLNGFESDHDSWTPNPSYVTEGAVVGKGLLTKGGNVSVYVDPFYDLSGFDRFTLNVYSNGNYVNGIFAGQQQFALQEGHNTITMTAAEFATNYPNGVGIDNNGRPYIELYANAAISGIELVLDQFIGIFDNFEEDTSAPIFDFGMKYRTGSTEVAHGKIFTVPDISEFNVYDNSMEACTLEFTVKKTDGTDITEEVKAGTFTADHNDGTYVIVFTATDAAGNRSESRELTVIVLAPKPFDVLQAFEDENAVTGAVGTREISSEHAVEGNCVKWTVGGPAWAQFQINLAKDGAVLTEEDIAKYEYFQFTIYSESEENATLWSLVGSLGTIVKGENVIKISKENFIAAVNASAEGQIALQMQTPSNSTFVYYIDSFIGVYAE